MFRISENMGDFNGWLLLDKPIGISSNQAILKIRRHWHGIKLGHGGTLDPLASGLLPVAIGEATKTVELVMNCEKSYRFSVKWGISTDTLDRSGEIIARSDYQPNYQEIVRVLPAFIGKINQTPPIYSAIKVNGKRAYTLARKGEKPKLSARPVFVQDLKLIDHRPDCSSVFEMTCGKGVYVRSIVRDIASVLNSCAVVETLCRTGMGFFSLNNSLPLDKILKIPYTATADTLTEQSCFVSIEDALRNLPALKLDPIEALKLKNGISVPTLKARPRISSCDNNNQRFVVWSLGQVVALTECQNGYIKPKRVFNRLIRPLYMKGSL